MILAVRAKLLEGNRGRVVGIANEQSDRLWLRSGLPRVRRQARRHVSQRQSEQIRRAARGRTRSAHPDAARCAHAGNGSRVRAHLKDWGALDFLVHSIAVSPKEALYGRVTDAGRDGFLATMDISCWSFIRIAHLAEPLMPRDGTLCTMTFFGGQIRVENYNIKGVAKAALGSAVRYIAAERGPKGIRLHAISPGPLANAFRPSFKLAGKEREGTRVRKHYHTPATPCDRLLADPRTSAIVRKRVEALRADLDPVHLLGEMRAGQQAHVAMAARAAPVSKLVTLEPEIPVPIATFLAGLRTAWQSGEGRPIAQAKPKQKRGRRRPDPLVAVTEELPRVVQGRYVAHRGELLVQLQTAHPGCYPDALLRTVQRRLKA